MDNSEIFLIGLKSFLAQHSHISQALQQKVLSFRQNLLQVDAKLVQFSVTPFVCRSAIDLEFVREKAIMTIHLTDDEQPGDIKISGRIMSDLQLIELGNIDEGKIQDIIEQFNYKYGSAFYDSEELGMTTSEYVKTQKLKAATREYLDDNNLAGVGISLHEIVFYLAKKLSKKKIKELYPATIEDIPVVFKQTGAFLP